MRNIINIALLLGCSFNVSSQSATQNCMGAIPICQNIYTQSTSYTGQGTLNELNGTNQGCLTTGENNSVWYIFNTATSGTLVFTITPNTPSDYDFAIWDLTDKSCNAIGAGLQPIRCNYASLPNSTLGGLTGLSTSIISPSIGAGGGSFSSAINAVAGQTFVILVNNSSGSSSGYQINFTGSTSQIQDNIPPFVKSDSIQSSCTGPSSIKLLLSENIICTSFATNGSDFVLSPSIASISSANSISCGSGGAFTNLISLNFSSQLTPGNYTITSTLGSDGNTLIDNCGNAMLVGSTFSFTVASPIHASVLTQFGCAGTPSGVITASGTGGSLPYSYKLNANPFTTNNVFSGLYPGTYTITIKDNNGCLDDTIINLVQGPAIQINSAIVSNVICYGLNSGSVIVNAIGGTPPLSYSVGSLPYSTNNTISNLSPGNHFIHVKDANGCIKDTLIFISSPGQISINSLLLTNATCGNNNGVIQVNAFGGIAPLVFSFNTNPFQSSSLFTNLAPGIYTLHIKDANSCLKDTVINILPINIVGISALNIIQPSCAGNSGSIAIIGTSGMPPYTYSLDGINFTTSNTFNTLSSGTYTVTIKDANGCTSSSSSTLNSPTNLFFSNSSIVIPTCINSGSITVNGIGGAAPYLFALGTGLYSTVNTFTPLVPGTYIVHIKDNNGCIHDTSIVLTNTLVPTINNLNIIHPTCSFPNAGEINMNASGGVAPLSYSINLSPYTNNNIFSNLSGGTYTVTVKDANGCTHSSVAILNSTNTLSFTSVAHTNIGCNGVPLASITAIIGNGNLPYMYSLNGGIFQTSGNFNGIATAGTYTVVGQDASGCTISTLIVITSSSTLNFNTISTSNSPCFTPPTGAIQVSGNASAGPILYSLNYGLTNSTGIFNALTPGNYTVSIQDANGCNKDTQLVVPGPPPMHFSNVVLSLPPCNGGTGSVSLQGEGGMPAYSFSLNGGTYSSNSSWPVLVAGTYTIQLLDANGCTHDTVIFLVQPPPLSFSNFVVVNSSCAGIPTGSITVTATSGIPPFLYAINSGSFSSVSTFTGLGPGTYIVHAKDSVGCGKDSTIVINNNGNFTINNIIKTKPNCNGESNGMITFTANGGTPPYQYAINSGSFGVNNTFTGLTAGNYTLHTKDNAGCFKDSVIQLIQPSILTFASIAITNAICNGTPTGSLIVNATGGTSPYEAKIDAGLFTPSGVFTNLMPGQHTLSLKDSKGCLRDSIIFIGQPPALHFSNVSIINPGCLGTVGLITLGGTGGVSPYTFAIGSGAYSSSGMFNNLPVGSYTLHVKDNNGCIVDTIINIVSSQQIALTNLVASTVLCFNSNLGYINASATTLYPPINYTINAGSPQTSGFFTGLGPGSYTLHVEDQNGCYVDTVIQIQTAPPIQINNIVITNALCYNSSDGSILVYAIGGLGSLRYAYNTGSYLLSNSFLNLTAANYTVHVKDSIGCQKDSIVQVTSPPALYFSSINLTSPYCSSATDGKITINASGGQPPYVYAINTSLFTTNNIFQNLFQGIYTIYVKDYNGCIYDTVINLVASNYMDFTNVIVNDISCKYGNDGSISLNVIGGINPYQFTINSVATGSSSYFGSLAAGAYTIHVTDVSGCESDTVISVNEPLFPVQALIQNIVPNICRGDSIGSITAAGSGGTAPYTYSIDGINFQSSPVFNGLYAGSYFITIKDNNGCEDDTLAIVTEPDTSVQLFLIGIKDISCIDVNDGSILVTSKYGFSPITYYMNGSAVGVDTFYKNLSPGNYIVEVKDGLGCKSTGKFVVQPSDRRPYIIIDSVHGVLCAGDKDGAIDWHATNTFPPYYYTFDSLYLGTTSFIKGISNGTYSIHVVDSIGCKADTTVTIEEGDKLDLNIIASPALCQGLGDDGKAQAIVIGGVEPFQYVWSGSLGNNSNSAINLLYGNQVAYVKDGLGCVDSAQFEIEYDPCCIVNLPNAFSPNGDGVNDIYRIIKFGYITLVSFEIYNRWGNRVFTTLSENNGWDGKYQGENADLGTYYYLLRYKCHLKNETIMQKGDVTLIR